VVDLARYLIRASYTTEGVQGVLTEGGTGRRDAIGKLLADMGGTLESLDFAFGEDDVYVTVELPDNVSAAAVALTIAGSGAVRLQTTVLLTPEEIDQATKMHVKYRPPGK
jgi:uncharacterized protein with GYD domain